MTLPVWIWLLLLSRGTILKIALWGFDVNQVGNGPIDCDSTPCPVLVVVCYTFEKNYQDLEPGKFSNKDKLQFQLRARKRRRMKLDRIRHRQSQSVDYVVDPGWFI